MDHEFKKEGHNYQAGLYIYAGIIILPIGLGMVFSYPDPLWWLGLLLCLSTTLLIYSGIQTKRKIKQESIKANKFLKDIQKEK